MSSKRRPRPKKEDHQPSRLLKMYYLYSYKYVCAKSRLINTFQKIKKKKKNCRLLFFDCKIGNFKIAGLVCLQKNCLHFLLWQICSIMHCKLNRWHWKYYIVYKYNFDTFLWYSEFHGFGQAYLGCILNFVCSSWFPTLPQLPYKITLNSKVVKIDSKIIISSRKSKSVKHSVGSYFEKWKNLEI